MSCKENQFISVTPLLLKHKWNQINKMQQKNGLISVDEDSEAFYFLSLGCLGYFSHIAPSRVFILILQLHYILLKNTCRGQKY